jgi:hypothetical protein
MAVRDFRTSMAGGAPSADTDAKANAIVAQYISHEGKTQINLRSDTHKKLTAAIAANTITMYVPWRHQPSSPLRHFTFFAFDLYSDMFNEAEDEIMSLMSADSFNRFKLR